MKLIKQKPKEEKNQDWLHCPVCQARKVHIRRVSCGLEVWTCTKCHNVQSYLLGEEDEDEE